MGKQNKVKNWWQNKQEKKEEKKRLEGLEIVKAFVKQKESERKLYQLKEKNGQFFEQDEIPNIEVYYGKWDNGNFTLTTESDGEPSKKIIRPDNAYLGLHNDIWSSKYIDLSKRTLILLWTLDHSLKEKGLEMPNYELVFNDSNFVSENNEGQFLINLKCLSSLAEPAYHNLMNLMLQIEYSNQINLLTKYCESDFKKEYEKDLDYLFLKSMDTPIRINDEVIDKVLLNKANLEEDFDFAIYNNQKFILKAREIYNEIFDYAAITLNMMGSDEIFEKYKKSSQEYYQLSDYLFSKFIKNKTKDEFFESFYLELDKKHKNSENEISNEQN